MTDANLLPHGAAQQLIGLGLGGGDASVFWPHLLCANMGCVVDEHGHVCVDSSNPCTHRLIHPQSLERLGWLFGILALAHLRLLCGLHAATNRRRRRIVNLCGGIFIRRRQLLARGIVGGGVDVVDAGEGSERPSRA